MRNIRKSPEPPSLTQHRRQGGTFGDAGAKRWKDDLKHALLKDQGHLCCYCMGRIAFDDMKVEHRLSQHARPDQQLAYRNLLGACLGSERNPHHDGQDLRHCDTSKGGQPLELDPVADVEHRIRYGFVDGRIFSEDLDTNRELDVVLNLNAQHLRFARQAVFQQVKVWLDRKYATRSCSRDVLKRELDRWQERDGDRLRPFCQVAIAYLQRKLGPART